MRITASVVSEYSVLLPSFAFSHTVLDPGGQLFTCAVRTIGSNVRPVALVSTAPVPGSIRYSAVCHTSTNLPSAAPSASQAAVVAPVLATSPATVTNAGPLAPGAENIR